ncbi:hypothetical protein DXV76_05165 [Rhodobacteraceae bacterium CCMM004]|nr:hypothetical protein DXV76_05165 [Rhodobacteraceae bacterium CCMM004]
MPDPQPPPAAPPPRRRGRGHLTAWAVLALVLGVAAAGVAALALTGRVLVVPQEWTRGIETRLNRGLAGAGAITLGEVQLSLDRRFVPRLTLRDVTLSDGAGGAAARLNRIGVAFAPGALLRGRLAPRTLRLDSAQITLRRDAEGALRLSFGGGGGAVGRPADLLDALDAALARPPLDRTERVEIDGLTVTLEDARSSRVWQVTGGALDLVSGPDGAEIALRTDIFNGTDTLGRAVLTVRTRRDSAAADVSARLENVAAQDIALQSPVLAFLGVLDAPLSGALRGVLDADGTLDRFAGTLEIGAGAVQPRAEAVPLRFDSAKAYFTYDPARRRIAFSEVSAVTDAGRGTLTGHADLADLGPGGWPRALVAQLRVGDLTIDAGDAFAAPLSFDAGAADVRLRLDPFAADIGQVTLIGAEERLTLRGAVDAGPEGWRAALDLAVPRIAPERLVRYWPLKVAPGTRRWLDRNLSGGAVTGLEAALRLGQGARPTLGATFAFEGLTARFLPEMPPIGGARGYASVIADRFALVLDAGQVAAPGGGVVEVGGSRMVVPDTAAKPSVGTFEIAAQGPLPALLSVLDRPPVRVMARAGRAPDLARGTATVRAELSLPLQKDVPVERVAWRAEGTVRDVVSTALVPGRRLTAARLDLTMTPERLTVAGDATLDGVAIRGARYVQPLGPGATGGTVTGRASVGASALDALGVDLPDGSLGGSGSADIAVRFGAGRLPELDLTSDLRGLTLAVPALGWRKGAGTAGTLEMTLRLGETPEVARLALDAAGLSAEGRIALRQGGGLDTARFDRLRLDGWLDAQVTLTGRGPGAPPAVALTGGQIDIRRASFGGAGGGGGGSGAARGPVRLALDRVILNDTIALAPMTGRLEAGRALSGTFEGRVNGGAQVAGTLAGGPRGTAVRIRAQDAGAVLRSAGLFRQVGGGQMELILQPTGAEGTYDGQITVDQPRLANAPALADLLTAISVVGLLDRLNGRGIVFDQAEAVFRLTPGRIVLYRSSAVGASLGISMDGIYDTASKRMDLQGVISPIYMLNAIGAIFTRRGEGLFGFNFRLRGTPTAPQVSVNPLSLLTPGMFRDIFRRPPPARN